MTTFTRIDYNRLDGHTWNRKRKDNKTGRYNHKYGTGKYLRICEFCSLRRRALYNSDKGGWRWAYLVNGEFTFERPNCVRAIGLTSI
jgi:hypothetical protein